MNRPRPNADLAAVTAAIHPDGRIEITGAVDAAQGRVFAWLVDQIQDARACISDKVFTPEQVKTYEAWLAGETMRLELPEHRRGPVITVDRPGNVSWSDDRRSLVFIPTYVTTQADRDEWAAWRKTVADMPPMPTPHSTMAEWNAWNDWDAARRARETNSDHSFGVPLPKNVTVDTSAMGGGNVTVSTDGSVAIGNITIRAVDPLLIDPDAKGWMP